MIDRSKFVGKTRTLAEKSADMNQRELAKATTPAARWADLQDLAAHCEVLTGLWIENGVTQAAVLKGWDRIEQAVLAGPGVQTPFEMAVHLRDRDEAERVSRAFGDLRGQG